MSQLKAGSNPWLSMWGSPRKTIRRVIDHDPRYGVIWLSGIYVFQSLIFYLNFWSLGLRAPKYALLIPSLLLSPALGFVWLMFYGWIVRGVARWFGGRAPASHVRAALAWSRLPIAFSLLVWLFLWKLDSSSLFIQYGPGLASDILTGSIFFLEGWTLLLFIPALSEVQGFSLLRSLCTISIAWIFYTCIQISLLIILKILSLYLPLTSKIVF